jgi:hypothetical protein
MGRAGRPPNCDIDDCALIDLLFSQLPRADGEGELVARRPFALPAWLGKQAATSRCIFMALCEPQRRS